MDSARVSDILFVGSAKVAFFSASVGCVGFQWIPNVGWFYVEQNHTWRVCLHQEFPRICVRRSIYDSESKHGGIVSFIDFTYTTKNPTWLTILMAELTEDLFSCGVLGYCLAMGRYPWSLAPSNQLGLTESFRNGFSQGFFFQCFSSSFLHH